MKAVIPIPDMAFVSLDGTNEMRFTYIASSLDDMDSKQLFKTIEGIVSLCESYNRYSEENNHGYVNKNTGEVVVMPPNVVRVTEKEQAKTCSFVLPEKGTSNNF